MKASVKIVLFISLSLLCCQILFWRLSYGLSLYHVHNTERLNELLLNKTYYDMLFLGSSRTYFHINPQIIDSVCKTNSYNAGVKGGNLLEFNMILEAYLVNHPAPKYLVLTLDLTSFDIKKKLFDQIQYLPYLSNKVIEETLKKNGYKTNLYKILPFLELTEYDDYTRSNCIKGFKGLTEIPEGDFHYKGYLSNTANSIKNEDTTTYIVKADISALGLTILNKIIKTCSDRQIKLIFSYAPEYRNGLQSHILNSSNIIEMIANKASKNNIRFLRFDTASISKNPALFANPGHLNKIGAYYYSRSLALELKHTK